MHRLQLAAQDLRIDARYERRGVDGDSVASRPRADHDYGDRRPRGTFTGIEVGQGILEQRHSEVSIPEKPSFIDERVTPFFIKARRPYSEKG